MKTSRIIALAFAAAMMVSPVINSTGASARRTSQSYKKNKKRKCKVRTCTKVSVASLFSNNVGKYPYEVKLFQNAELRQRLVKMMGDEAFKAMEDNFNVVGPIEKNGDTYTVFGGQVHNAGCTNATITYDAKTNLLTVDTNTGCSVEQRYSEN